MNGQAPRRNAPAKPRLRGRLQIIGVLFLAALLGACSAVRLAYNNLADGELLVARRLCGFRRRAVAARARRPGRAARLASLRGTAAGARAAASGTVRSCRMTTAGTGLRIRRRNPRAPAGHGGARRRTGGRGGGHALACAAAASAGEVREGERRVSRRVGVAGRAGVERQALSPRLDRHDFYGALHAEQRAMLRRMAAESVFDAKRRRRAPFAPGPRSWRCCGASSPSARHRPRRRRRSMRWCATDPSAGPWREHQTALQDEGCRHPAALHNTTTPAQRSRAVDRLGRYARDADALMAAD